jgi:thiol-disulfide isomerase/thioredoxin
MKIISFLLILICMNCMLMKADAQSVELLKFDELNSRVTSTNDTLYVINFWATWCKPCVEELPSFEKCNDEYKNGKFKMLLVNLDFNSQVNKSVIPFINKKNLRCEILHITETDPNSWINKVDEKWSGAIPATVIYQNGKKLFFTEGEISELNLRNEIQKAR